MRPERLARKHWRPRNRPIEAAMLFAVCESGDHVEVTMMKGGGSGAIGMPRSIAILLGRHLADLSETRS